MLLGCVPYVISYDHLCLEEADGLRIKERSTTSENSQHEELHFARIGLPTEAELTRPGFRIKIYTPLNTGPVLFLEPVSSDGAELKISGFNIYPTSSGVAASTQFKYWFDVKSAKGSTLVFTIEDSTGKVIGRESLRYKIRSRGFGYGVDAI